MGVAMVVAGLWAALWVALRRTRARHLLRVAFGLFVVSLVAFQFVIQDDYRQAWQQHRDLTRRLIELTPDATPDSTIVVRLYWRFPEPFNTYNRFLSIGEEKAMFCRVLTFLYEYGQARPDVLFVYGDEWRDHLELRPDGNLHWTSNHVPNLFAFERNPLKPGKVIQIYELKFGRYARLNEPFFRDGVQLMQPYLPVSGSFWAGLSPSPLYRHVFPELE
jgi:hypothetical protein